MFFIFQNDHITGYLMNIRYVIFPIFQHDQNTGYLLNITLIFGRCSRSIAVVTPDKHERDSKELKHICKKSIFFLADKRSFSSPH